MRARATKAKTGALKSKVHATALQLLPRSEERWSKVESVWLQGEAELAKAKAIEVKAASAALGEADQGEISELQKRRAEIEEKTSVAVQDGSEWTESDTRQTAAPSTIKSTYDPGTVGYLPTPALWTRLQSIEQYGEPVLLQRKWQRSCGLPDRPAYSLKPKPPDRQRSQPFCNVNRATVAYTPVYCWPLGCARSKLPMRSPH